MKWKLVPNQVRFIPYRTLKINYSGLYLNNTGKPVKLVYNREWYDSDLCLETFTFRVLGPKWITGVKNICEGNI